MARFELTRISTIWFVTLGVTVLAAGILIYILLIESALGAFSIREANPMELRLREQPRIALLRSEYTEQAHRTLNGLSGEVSWVEGTLRSWRDFLLDRERDLSFSEISDAQIEAGDLDDFDVLVLPSTRALSDREIENIKAFMEAGGSVLATWTPGIYRPDGSWRGWSFIEEAFGVSFVDFVERGAGNFRVYQDTFPGVTTPGIYRPNRAFDDPDDPAYGTEVEGLRTDFPPLRGYRHVGDPDTTPPQADYALADTLTIRLPDAGGRMTRQRAVAVTYYTWVGGDPEAETPYPYTGSGIRRFTFVSNSPLTANIPSGYRVKIQVYNPGVRMRIIDERTHSAGFWYDFAVEDQVVEEAITTSAGAVYGTYGQGRFVYLGFQRDAMGVGPEDREDYAQLATFFANIMNYLQRKPVIWVHDWPHPYRAAAVLSGVGENNLENFAGVADLLAQQGAPGTYFVRPAQAASYGSLMQRLYQSGDVGVLDDLQFRADGSEEFQEDRLRDLRETLETIVGGPVTGYHSTRRGMFSDWTMSALKDAEYRYFIADSIGRRTVPKIMGFPFETLTRIGVSAHSDHDVFNRLPDESVDLRSILFREDITRVSTEGSLYHLMYSSDQLGAPENRVVLNDVIRTLKEEGYWIVAGDELTTWWRLRLGLNVDIEQRSDSRIIVRISNNNGDTAERVGVSVALGRPVERIKIQPELIGTPVPEYELLSNQTELLLSIERLKPQQYRIFHIDLLDAERAELLGVDE